jgi:hypothetical protein
MPTVPVLDGLNVILVLDPVQIIDEDGLAVNVATGFTVTVTSNGEPTQFPDAPEVGVTKYLTV